MVDIKFTNVYSDELLEIYIKMRKARYVGSNKHYSSKRAIKKHLKHIILQRRQTENLLDIMIMTIEDKIVGMSFPRLTKDIDKIFYDIDTTCIKVGAIFVDPDYRNQNIGYDACSQFFKLFPEYTKVWTSRKCNTASIALALKLGFERTHDKGDYVIFKMR
jgi:GNAT superfamily N-acetyltransferase